MDAADAKGKLSGQRWGLAALILAAVNLVVLVVGVQVLGSLGIDVHFAHPDRMPRWVNLSMAGLTLCLAAPLIVGVVGLFADKKKTLAWCALAGCVLVIVCYGCAAE